MACTDIRIQLSFRNHPKIEKLRRRLGEAGPLAFIYLLMHAGQNETEGRLHGMDAEDISIAADWRGEPEVLLTAMIDLRLIDQTPEGYEIHDFADHNPWATGSKRRSEIAKQAINSRWEKIRREKKQENKDVDTGRIRSEPEARSDRNTPSPSPTPSPTLTSPIGDVCPEPEADSGPPPCPHEKIIGLYHQTLPELRRVKTWPEPRRKLLAARWREARERQNLAWWEAFFATVRESPFLMGRNDRGWTADLEWLISPRNLAKVFEGRYRGGVGEDGVRGRDRPPDDGPVEPDRGDREWRQVLAEIEAERKAGGKGGRHETGQATA